MELRTIRGSRGLSLVWPAMLVVLLAVPTALAQNNQCDQPGEAPDVIVGSLYQLNDYGSIGGISAYSVGTNSCNIGTCWLNWISNTNAHPVIGQSMYRLKDGRFEHIGQSWLKHGFTALSQTLCSPDCLGTNGNHLGVNCSDPYSANLNGDQDRLGPKFEVNAFTGVFPYPATDLPNTGNAIYKRLQVASTDVEPAQNIGALYFVEGHYVTQDDAAAGNHDNNASWREVNVTPDTLNFAAGSTTEREEPAIFAWPDNEASVDLKEARVPGEGLVFLATKVTDLGGGLWHYEYALHNLNSHRSIRSFRVPISAGVNVTNVGFHDVDYHSGEPWDGTDWPATVGLGFLMWQTDSFAANENANALRWGTLYNFRFDADAPPDTAELTLGIFRPGSPTSYTVSAQAPFVCTGPDTDDDGLCDLLDTDDDNDGVEDDEDSDPLDPFVCRDVDGDTCDDCSSGMDDPLNDGPDFDQDGLCDAGDPDDDNDTVPDGADTDPLDPQVCQDVDGDGCDDCSQAQSTPAPPLVDADFEGNADGFTYLDDTFRDTSEPAYADGTTEAGGGFSGDGLLVTVGGVNGNDIIGMSGGWRIPFDLTTSADPTLSLRYNLTMSEPYEPDELSQVLVSVDGVLFGQFGNDYVDQLVGDGQGNGTDVTTGWLEFSVQTGLLSAGSHTLTIGGYNSKKTTTDEVTWVRFDDVLLDPNTVIPDGPDPADDGADFDGDGLCDLGDPDDDNDGVPDLEDCAPYDPDVVALPEPVGNTVQVGKFPGIVRVYWLPGSGAQSSNVYAGSILPAQPWSYNETCLASAVVGTSYDDVPPGAGSPPTYYLISARNSCGESLLAVDSSSNEHYADPACP